jgi:phosphohistidine phosphatase
MELILWRHADAEPGMNDSKRELTDKGRRQAARVAKWIKRRIDKDWLVLASPAARAQQTAEALGVKFETRIPLGTGTNPTAVLREAHWPDGRKNVVIVGHQPTLGQVASQLLTDTKGDMAIKKGAAWWFSNGDGNATGESIQRAVIAPDHADDV